MPLRAEMSYIILCSDPIEPAAPDSAFAAEVEASRQAGLTTLLIDHDALLAGDLRRALRRLRAETRGAAVYRGWMMQAETYACLYTGLGGRGISLLTSPEAYASCHHLPEAYHHVGRWMPETACVLPSPFFTADFALGRDGKWWLMETGDGQVSGFPDGAAEIVLPAVARKLGQIIHV